MAAYLLARNGGKMNILPLVKMLYLADRKAWEEFGEPLTFDTYASMDNGPIVSTAYDLMNRRRVEPGEYWNNFISPRKGNQLDLLRDGEIGELSPAIVEILDEVYEKVSALDKEHGLANYCHDHLPEWEKPPKGSSRPLPYVRILESLGFTPVEIDAIEQSLRSKAYIESMMA